MAYTLTAEKREQTGRQLDGLRKESKVPAVLYGTGVKENVSLAVNLQEFAHVYSDAGSSQVVELTADGTKYDVIVRDVQIDPITRDAIHVDFFAIDANQEITVDIPLEFIGAAPAVKSSGGSLMMKLRALPVKCLPKNLVKSISVELDSLKTIEDTITVDNLNVPEGMDLQIDASELVATVVPPKVEAAAPAAAEETTAEEATPAEGGEEAKSE